MSRSTRIGTVAGACGLVLFASGVAYGQGADEPSLLAPLLGAASNTQSATTTGVQCQNHPLGSLFKTPISNAPHPCINGPVNSGNSDSAGNAVIHGNPNGSGNMANSNGSTNSGSFLHGTWSNSFNGIQRINGRRH